MTSKDIKLNSIPEFSELQDGNQLLVMTDYATNFWQRINIPNFIKSFMTKSNPFRLGTGWKNVPELIYDSSARTVTLNGDIEAYYQGSLVEGLFVGWVSPAHADTYGTWFLSWDVVNNVPIWSQNVFDFNDILIAIVQYQQNYKFAQYETHGGNMPASVHINIHDTIGAYLKAGGDVQDYTLNSATEEARRPNIGDTYIADEDLLIKNNALASGSYTQFFIDGLAPVYLSEQSEIVPINGTVPYYNLNGEQIPMDEGKFQTLFLMGIPTTSDTHSQNYRFIFIQGQEQYDTLAKALAITPSSINLHTNFQNLQEYVIFKQIIIESIDNNWHIASVADIEENKFSVVTGGGNSGLTVVSTKPLLKGAGTAGNPLDLSNPKDSKIYGVKDNGYAEIVETPLAPLAISTLSGVSPLANVPSGSTWPSWQQPVLAAGSSSVPMQDGSTGNITYAATRGDITNLLRSTGNWATGEGSTVTTNQGYLKFPYQLRMFQFKLYNGTSIDNNRVKTIQLFSDAACTVPITSVLTMANSNNALLTVTLSAYVQTDTIGIKILSGYGTGSNRSVILNSLQIIGQWQIYQVLPDTIYFDTLIPAVFSDSQGKVFSKTYIESINVLQMANGTYTGAVSPDASDNTAHIVGARLPDAFVDPDVIPLAIGTWYLNTSFITGDLNLKVIREIEEDKEWVVEDLVPFITFKVANGLVTEVVNFPFLENGVQPNKVTISGLTAPSTRTQTITTPASDNNYLPMSASGEITVNMTAGASGQFLYLRDFTKGTRGFRMVAPSATDIRCTLRVGKGDMPTISYTGTAIKTVFTYDKASAGV